MSILIRNGHVVTAVDDYVADIFVDGDKVRAIGSDLAVEPDKIVDAAGKFVIPGGVDPHTHLDFPFGGTVTADDFRTGTIAAAAGGTTSIVDFAVQEPGSALSQSLETWHAKAEGRAAIDYGFHMVIRELPDSRLPEMDEMVRQGVTSFKMFMAFPGGRDGRRLDHLQGADPRLGQWGLHLPPRRARHDDRRAGEAGVGRGEDGAEVPRHDAAPPSPRRRRPIGPSAWRRSPARRSTSST